MGILKALVAALIAGLGTAATAVTDGHITTAEWIAVASTTLVALYGVWQAPNATAKPAVAEPPSNVTIRPAGTPTTRTTQEPPD